MHVLALAWDFLWWPQTGKWYAFWSSFGACLGYFTIFVIVFRKLNCHTKGCWRMGHHQVEGTPFIVCRKHHPSTGRGAPTHEHILAMHRRATTGHDQT